MKHNHRHFPLVRVACASLGLAAASAFAQSTTPSTPPTDSPATVPSTPSNPSRSTDTYSNPTNPNDATVTTDRSTTEVKANTDVKASGGVAVTPNAEGETESPRKIEKFIEKSAMIDAEQMRLSEVAQERATNAQVKAFAQMLVSEHQAASQELQTIAQSKNVVLPTGKKNEAEEEALEWRDKDAEEFDEDYVEKMIDFHKEKVDLFSDTAEDSEDAELAAYARKHLPKLQEHLRKAQELEKVLD